LRSTQFAAGAEEADGHFGVLERAGARLSRGAATGRARWARAGLAGILAGGAGGAGGLFLSNDQATDALTTGAVQLDTARFALHGPFLGQSRTEQASENSHNSFHGFV